MRLFVEDYKEGYMEIIDGVERVKIEKQDNVNYLFGYNKIGYIFIKKLADIKLAFMVDITREDCKEYFRYEK